MGTDRYLQPAHGYPERHRPCRTVRVGCEQLQKKQIIYVKQTGLRVWHLLPAHSKPVIAVIHTFCAFFIDCPTLCEHKAKFSEFQHLVVENCRKLVDFRRANMIQCCQILLYAANRRRTHIPGEER